jgi:hypothetical protein
LQLGQPLVVGSVEPVFLKSESVDFLAFEDDPEFVGVGYDVSGFEGAAFGRCRGVLVGFEFGFHCSGTSSVMNENVLVGFSSSAFAAAAAGLGSPLMSVVVPSSHQIL